MNDQDPIGYSLRVLAIIAIVVIVLIVAVAARAEARCYPTSQVLSHITTKYAETAQETHALRPDLAIAIWANAATKTYTVTLIGADGVTCIFDAGKNYDPATHTLSRMTFHGNPIVGPNL